MRRIADFELIDHGIKHSQYFQGCGVAFTRFANVATGIGDNPAEAIDDCLEQVATDGWDTEGMEARIAAEEGWDAIPTTPSVAAEFGCDETGHDETNETFYHVSIRWNGRIRNMTTATATDKLAEMLTENTGRSFLDSGDHYGRNWEQNQGADFEAQPEGELEFWQRDRGLDICATINVYHFLKDRLEYNPELDNKYREYAEANELDVWLPSAEDFVKSINGKGIYGDDEPLTINTYNGEDLLSQILQYVYWTDDDGAHVLLQIHGGCDARGGYTDPIAFDVEETSIFDNARASIFCKCGTYWDTDDSCHWYPDGCCGQGHKQLEDYPATDQRPTYPEKQDPSQQLLPVDLPERPEPWCADVIWVDDDKNGHCPYCGGLLHLAQYPIG